MGMSQILRLNFTLLGIFILIIVHVGSSDINSKVETSLIGNENITNNLNGVAHLKKEEEIEIKKDVVRSNSSKPLKDIEDVESVGSVRLGEKSGVENDKSRDEECDPSYMCVDEKKNLTACLRVPGNDSPDLSLLIQNKGTSPVIVTITAPDFVQLEETKVQLREKEDKKVKVSIISYKGIDSVILLTAKDSQCKLDLKELIRHDSRVEDTHYTFNLRSLSNFTRNHLIIFLALTVFILLGCGYAYLGSHKKLLFGYKAIDTELPVSSAVLKTTVSETNDSWGNSWDDGWDDEEAPMTPTLPVTPSLSSRGLASRRLSKEAWKD